MESKAIDLLLKTLQSDPAASDPKEEKNQGRLYFSKQILPNLSVVLERTDAPAQSVRQTKNCAELAYQCTGQTTHQLDGGGKVLLKEGEILLLQKNLTDRIAFLKDGATLLRIQLGAELSADGVPQEDRLSAFLAQNIRGNAENSVYLQYFVGSICTIQNTMENFMIELSAQDGERFFVLQSLLKLVIFYLSASKADHWGKEKKKYGDTLLLVVQEYIAHNYRTANLAELAEQTNQTIYGLSKLIKHETGKSFKELLQTKRLTVAEQMLLETDFSIRDIILAVGYDNASYFYRIFQEKYGVTPKKYREN